MSPFVKAITPLADYRLLVTFENAERRVFDLTPYLDKGVFQQLRDPARFRQARVVVGSIEWPGEVDLSYDTIYLTSQPVLEAAAA
ncbi:MAG: DUF2442 domain-containing protein [Pseudomonadota bacterium]|nr:DUF2442 domain-containing protein [Pseudomonadota bacterium]